MSENEDKAPPKTRRPPDDAFRQQKLAAWQPIMTPLKVIIIFFAIGIAFVPTGTYLMSQSDAIYEQTITYDGTDEDVSCSIDTQNEGKQCIMTFKLDQDVSDTINVYYELKNYYQNHRRYVASRSSEQLQGSILTKSYLDTYCSPKVETDDNILLNPCGLIANSLFTDTIQSLNASMDETSISWASDRTEKYAQPDGFKYQQVANATIVCSDIDYPSDCKSYVDPSTNPSTYYLFYYPDDNTTQYLYETYPTIVSPIEGVLNEHFLVWMRTAGLPTFRKLYGRISGDFKKGDTLTFNVTANYEVASFDGSKSIVLSTVGQFGGKNPYLGVAYVVVGSLCLFFGFLFAVKHIASPRPLGDPSLLHWD